MKIFHQIKHGELKKNPPMGSFYYYFSTYALLKFHARPVAE